MVRTEDACEIIKYALQNEIKVYLDGGWGVDALLKRESRIHNDIDLFVFTKNGDKQTRIVKYIENIEFDINYFSEKGVQKFINEKEYFFQKIKERA